VSDERRTALVTGTSSGLGRGTAERLVSLGWDVLGTVRSPTDDVSFETVQLDVTDDAAVEALGRTIVDRWGRLDALVNNAGYALLGPVEELSAPEILDQLHVNTVAPMQLARACLPALRAAEGVVVQVSSVSGYSASPLFGAYNASKFGLEGASEALAREVQPHGVRVVLVEPGPFRTPITQGRRTRAAAHRSTGLYEEAWQGVEQWTAWHYAESPDASVAVDAIVAAATRPDAPFRVPVGEGIGDRLRERGEQLVAQAAEAEAFLRRT
jgi:NAD(P)-dependent dehydrogenase (short-subunit alcohol dehydrogenase family)